METLEHYGTKRHSGRYPWGSGGDNDTGLDGHELLSTIESLHRQGLSEKDISRSLKMSIRELRNVKTLIKMELKEADRLKITRMKKSGQSIESISRETGIPPSSVRDLLKPAANAKYRIIKTTADKLISAVSKFGFVDVGKYVEIYMGISRTKLDNAIAYLRLRGYEVHNMQEYQLGTGKKTRYMILGPPGSDLSDAKAARENIAIPVWSSQDGGKTYTEQQPINNIDFDRVHIVGGAEGKAKDGLIEVRPGVPELSLGASAYAQVRVGIGGSHYAKGMAVYGKKFPPGKDLVFYTSKDIPENPMDVLKEQKAEGINPFGAVVKKQRIVELEDGTKVASALNIVREEGDWLSWRKNLASQFLGKQDSGLAKEQLGYLLSNRKAELDEINSIPNKTLREHLLREYADGVDSDAVDLYAAALPRQTTSVLIPALTVKPTEVYAPNYQNGEVLNLVRYPHGGVFEIPTLVVNNKNPEMKSVIGSAKDAIGIHPDVAQRLSGADFDGDFVLTLPRDKRIRTQKPLEGLKDFDPHSEYPYFEGMKVMSDRRKQMEMGKVSNLITDMTIQGAPTSEIARAVRHSMVVIDAEKHKLNWKQSEIDNGISALKKKYQMNAAGRLGAATLLSASKSPVWVPQRKDFYGIDPTTGEKIWVDSKETFINKKGEEVSRMTKTNKMYETDDAHKLSSGTQIERVYADHANTLKSLGNQARLAVTKIEKQKRDPKATKAYSEEVASIQAKLKRAKKNSPLERKAQLVGGAIYKAKLDANPGMSPAAKKKERNRALVVARDRVGAKKERVDLTPREWEAIEMHAISPTMLSDVLRNSDMDKIRQYATPRPDRSVPPRVKNRARVLLDMGYTAAEIATTLGVTANQINNINWDE
jgi:hypothetical protein